MIDVREARSLGSPLRLQVARVGTEPSAGAIDAAWAAIQSEFEAVDLTMSGFRADSEVARLNQAGDAARLSRRLRLALVLTDRARRVTSGRFDPRVLEPLSSLGFTGAAPGRRTDRPALDRGEPVVRCTPGGYALPWPVDLGGIGKGLALRWAAAAAAARLPGASFLLDAGGDLVATGSGPSDGQGGTGWSIGIEDPLGANEPVATLKLAGDVAVATSSIRRFRRVAPGGEVHHLIDPATGAPGGDGLAAVTVVGRDPAWAEVWTKALFLAGHDRIAGEARARGLAAWWVDRHGTLSMTPAARQRTTWVRSEARPAGVLSPP